jgi:hypothetical protein
MLDIAFKEWAAICLALAAGEQRVILRKGGIHEEGGKFRPEHDRFWLYPTYFHEPQAAGLKPAFLPLLTAAEATRPPPGELRLTHWCEVESVAFADDLDALLASPELHAWSEATVRQRFHYRTPGLYVLTVTVRQSATTHVVPELPEYAGCKTWVTLDRALPTGDAP